MTPRNFTFFACSFSTSLLSSTLTVAPPTADCEGLSQGAYYGLMLAGVDYDVAWCMKSELAYEGSAMGSGGEFQAKMEQMLVDCREKYPPRRAQ